MNPLVAVQCPPYVPVPSPLQLIVRFYVIAYLALLLAGLACLGLRSLLATRSEGGDDLPADGYRRDSGRIGPGPPHASGAAVAASSGDLPATVTIRGPYLP